MYRVMLFSPPNQPQKVVPYTMKISDSEKEKILRLLKHVNDRVISKKKLYKEDQPAFTILKISPSLFVLIGQGVKGNATLVRNAQIGRGYFSRVKGGFLFMATPKNMFSDCEDYAIKIYNVAHYHQVQRDPMQDLVKEAYCCKQLYGFGEAVSSLDKEHYYLIMPRLPGNTLKNIDLNHYSLEAIFTCFYQVFDQVERLHQAKIAHGDLHTDNVQYDELTQHASILDFGLSIIDAKVEYQRRDWTRLFADVAAKLKNHRMKPTSSDSISQAEIDQLCVFFQEECQQSRLPSWQSKQFIDRLVALYQTLKADHMCTPMELG